MPQTKYSRTMGEWISKWLVGLGLWLAKGSRATRALGRKARQDKGLR